MAANDSDRPRLLGERERTIPDPAAPSGTAGSAAGPRRRARGEAGAQLLEADAGERRGAGRERGPRARRVPAGVRERPAGGRLAARDRDGGERLAEFRGEPRERGDLGRERRVVVRGGLL